MGLELARAFIRVRADSSQAGKDIDRSKSGILSRLGGIARSASGLMAGIGIPLGGAAVFGSLISGGETFNRKMRGSLAIMGDVSGALKDDMKQAALEAASATQFSASQAAESFFFLASAGLDAEQSIAALPQVAQFAQAGLFDMATATDLATDAQSALGLTVKDPTKNLANLTRVTDTLIKANTLANASAEQFSTALTTKAGVSARNAGKDIEETVAVLAAFADQGIKGQSAGTAFSIIMRDLQTKARENKKAFEAAGIAVFDEAGAMRNLKDITADLEGALAGMSTEQQAATLSQLGFADKSKVFLQTLIGTSSKIGEYEAQLRNAQGVTKEIADKQLTPIQKGIAKLGSAWTQLGTTIMSGTGDAVGGALSFIADMVDQTTGFVKEMQFIFRNFSTIAQIAILDLTMAGLRLFPMMETPVQEMAAFFIGTWSGLRAFFSTIIESMIGGLKELQNFAEAVSAGISAAFMAIAAGDITSAGSAFGEAFTKTLASQQDVQAKNAFAEFGKAFEDARNDTLQNFRSKGGLFQFLGEERKQLLDNLAKSEQALADARKGTPGKGRGPGAPAPAEEEGGGGLAPAMEVTRLGIAELGKTIQDELLKDDTPMNHFKEAQKQTEIMKEQLAATKRGGGGGLVEGGEPG